MYLQSNVLSMPFYRVGIMYKHATMFSCIFFFLLLHANPISLIFFRIMSQLTQPVECLINLSVYSTDPSEKVHVPWQNDLETSLKMYRKLCADKVLITAIITEIQTILEDVSILLVSSFLIMVQHM